MRGENRTLLAVALWAVSLIEANAQVVSDVRVEIRAFDHKRETAKNIKIGLVLLRLLRGPLYQSLPIRQPRSATRLKAEGPALVPTLPNTGITPPAVYFTHAPLALFGSNFLRPAKIGSPTGATLTLLELAP
jgi:hypothetical protein